MSATPELLLSHGYLLAADARERRIMRPYPPLGLLSLSAYLKRRGHSVEVMESLPVYHFLTREQDMSAVLAYSGSQQIPQGTQARFAYNWSGAMVYDGVVYDQINYRLRGGNGRHQGTGKRSMRFRFNDGHYFQARDQDGELLPVT